MKTFVFIIYILFIIILPQLFTWLIRLNKRNRDNQAFIIIVGGAIMILLFWTFTIALTNWEIINIIL